MMFLIIGHDALDYNLSSRLLSSLERGQLGIMHSEYGSTVPSWTSIYTGLTREEHTIGVGGSSWRDWIYNQVKTKITPLDTKNPRMRQALHHVLQTRGNTYEQIEAFTGHDYARIEQDLREFQKLSSEEQEDLFEKAERRLPTIYEKDYRTLPFVWNELSDAGLSVGLFGMPLTFPPFRLKDGWCVSGFPCLMDLRYIVWPSSLLLYMKNYTPDVLQAIDGSWVGKFKVVDASEHQKYKDLGGLDLVYDHVRRRLNNLAALWPRHRSDVLFAGFSFVDHTGHLGITSNLQMENLYKIADYSIKAVKTIVQPDKTLIVSDHGGDYVSVEIEENDERREVKVFKHMQKGVYYVEGDELCGEEKCEYEIKDEILRLAGI